MKKLLLLLLIIAAGNLALLGSLRGREFALLLVAPDRTGAVLDARPDQSMVARAGGVTVNYGGVQLRPAPNLPARTGGDRGMDDVRVTIRWVRGLLSVGEDYHPPDSWWLRDLLGAVGEQRRFLCDSYSRAAVNLMLREGYAARVVLLGGHIASEFYLPELGRWVFADALYDFIASDEAGQPLSVVEASRRLREGRAVHWTPVTGVRGDDDDLGPYNRAQLIGMLKSGRFRICDGAYAFGRLSREQRLRDLLLGRSHVVEYAPPGEPPIDRDERSIRGMLLVWNVLMLALAPVLLRRTRGAAPPVNASASPSR